MSYDASNYDVPVTPATIADEYARLETVSAKVRAMARDGYKTADIQKLLNQWYRAKHGRDLRYQHVRNILTQVVKKAD